MVLLPESSPWFSAVRRTALAWYNREARDLPWRKRSDPYAIWVSEVMLQQTQVPIVAAYFERFLDRFPTLALLAAASESDVLRAWEGLGYYRRARQLWQAARQVITQYGGALPRNRKLLEQLPGIGPYTAGAILSIAFDQPEPILEANTHRLWTRLLDYNQPPHAGSTHRRLWSAARLVLPRKGAGRLNQALMELGSRVCTSQRPLCEVCPLAHLCQARRHGNVHRVPRPRPRPRTVRVRHAAAVVWRQGRLLLVQGPDKGRWAGLWDFPRVALYEGYEPCEQLRQELYRRHGIAARPGPLLLKLTHAVTRYRIALECFVLYHEQGALRRNSGLHARWVAPAQLEGYPLSSTGRRIARQLAWMQAARPAHQLGHQKG